MKTSKPMLLLLRGHETKTHKRWFPKCNQYFVSKHGRDAICIKPKGHKNPDHAGDPVTLYEYAVTYGGGVGPDVWDHDTYIKAQNIGDAYKRVTSRPGWDSTWAILVIEQKD